MKKRIGLFPEVVTQSGRETRERTAAFCGRAESQAVAIRVSREE